MMTQTDIDLSHAKTALPGVAARGNVVTLAAAGFGIAVLIGLSVWFGREVRITADQADAAAIAQENQAFCTGLGLKSETAAYAKCVDGLNSVRQHQDERNATQAAGVL